MISDILTSYLDVTFFPEVIMLTGSRARDDFREDSDWDFLMFRNDNKFISHREEYNSEILDLSFFNLSSLDSFIKSNFINPITKFVILKDNSKNEGVKIIELIEKRLSEEPPQLSNLQIKNRYLRSKGFVNKLEAEINSQVFFYLISEIYTTYLRYWFELNKEWQLPPKNAFDYIKRNDEKFFNNLAKLASNDSSSKDKVSAVKELHNDLFDMHKF